MKCRESVAEPIVPSCNRAFAVLSDCATEYWVYGADPKPNLLGNMPLPIPNTMTFATIGVRL